MKKISIQRVTWKYLLLIMAIALTGIAIASTIAIQSVYEDNKRHVINEHRLLSDDLANLLNFYQVMVQNYAKTEEVKNLLLLNDKVEASDWALKLRKVIPDAIGVALIEPSGKVLGDRLELRLGDRCIYDLQNILKGNQISLPPVHRENIQLEHFDVVKPVMVHDENIGLIFISFSIEVLNRRLTQHITERQYIAIFDGNEQLITAAGDSEITKSGSNDIHKIRIKGSDWIIHYQDNQFNTNQLYLMTVAIGIITFLLTIILTLFLTKKLVKIVQVDLFHIKKLLHAIHKEKNTDVNRGETQLLETEEIRDELFKLSKDIQSKNTKLIQLSRTDSLTGLLNRSAFDEALRQQFALSNRKITAWLVMMDLDYFKQINDTYGHHAGDEVLRSFSQSLQERCRSCDIISRLGGDEFAVLLIGEMTANLQSWYDDLNNIFQKNQMLLEHNSGQTTTCKISAGAVFIEQTDTSVTEILKKADKCLYQAKDEGRARIYLQNISF